MHACKIDRLLGNAAVWKTQINIHHQSIIEQAFGLTVGCILKHPAKPEHARRF